LGLYARIAEARSATEPASTGVGSAAASTTVHPAGLVAREKVLTDRPSYGYRRVTRMLNRVAGQPRVNHKRIYRLMRAEGLLLQRGSGRPHRIHDDVVITLKSNLRWSSDCFEIACWNGEWVRVAFNLDCCDREVIRYAASPSFVSGEMIRDLMVESVQARFGQQARRLPHPIEWLSDNGPVYTADETVAVVESLGFVVCTTPPYSPVSNGMAESFVRGFKRARRHGL
jgi:transposase InsO family protein